MLALNSAIVYWEERGGQVIGKAVTMHVMVGTGSNVRLKDPTLRYLNPDVNWGSGNLILFCPASNVY